MIFGVVAGSQVTGGGGGGFAPGDFAFADITGQNTSTPAEASPVAGTLYIKFTFVSGDGVTSFSAQKNGVTQIVADFESPEPQTEGTIVFNVGDTLSFSSSKNPFTPGGDYVTITMRNNDSSGVLVDEFNFDSL